MPTVPDVEPEWTEQRVKNVPPRDALSPCVRLAWEGEEGGLLGRDALCRLEILALNKTGFSEGKKDRSAVNRHIIPQFRTVGLLIKRLSVGFEGEAVLIAYHMSLDAKISNLTVASKTVLGNRPWGREGFTTCVCGVAEWAGLGLLPPPPLLVIL